jgi:hypothetical protein
VAPFCSEPAMTNCDRVPNALSQSLYEVKKTRGASNRLRMLKKCSSPHCLSQ